MTTQPNETVISEIVDRRSSLGKPARITLYEDRIEQVENGRLVHRIALDHIKQVRLSIEMAGQDTQIVCRISSSSNQITVGSRSYISPGVWDNNAINYRTFVLLLHQLLRKCEQDVRYLEGQSLGFRLILSTLGGIIAGLAIIFAWHMITERDRPMLALAALPGLVIGGYLAWVFRPAVPLPYDPDGLIKRFDKSTQTYEDIPDASDRD